MEVFPVLEPRRIFARPLPTALVSRKTKMAQEMAMAVEPINDIHDVLEITHKAASDNNKGMMTKSQQTNHSKTNVIPFNFHIGDYVMMHRVSSRHG